MIQVQHISFKDWNPIGKPRKKPQEQSQGLSVGVNNGTLNDVGLNGKSTSTNKDPFGVAATLELTHSYVKDQNGTNQ